MTFGARLDALLILREPLGVHDALIGQAGGTVQFQLECQIIVYGVSSWQVIITDVVHVHIGCWMAS